jgi:hypothetical protein
MVQMLFLTNYTTWRREWPRRWASSLTGVLLFLVEQQQGRRDGQLLAQKSPLSDASWSPVWIIWARALSPRIPNNDRIFPLVNAPKCHAGSRTTGLAWNNAQHVRGFRGRINASRYAGLVRRRCMYSTSRQVGALQKTSNDYCGVAPEVKKMNEGGLLRNTCDAQVAAMLENI